MSIEVILEKSKTFIVNWLTSFENFHYTNAYYKKDSKITSMPFDMEVLPVFKHILDNYDITPVFMISCLYLINIDCKIDDLLNGNNEALSEVNNHYMKIATVADLIIRSEFMASGIHDPIVNPYADLYDNFSEKQVMKTGFLIRKNCQEIIESLNISGVSKSNILAITNHVRLKPDACMHQWEKAKTNVFDAFEMSKYIDSMSKLFGLNSTFIMASQSFQNFLEVEPKYRKLVPDSGYWLECVTEYVGIIIAISRIIEFHPNSQQIVNECLIRKLSDEYNLFSLVNKALNDINTTILTNENNIMFKQLVRKMAPKVFSLM